MSTCMRVYRLVGCVNAVSLVALSFRLSSVSIDAISLHLGIELMMVPTLRLCRPLVARSSLAFPPPRGAGGTDCDGGASSTRLDGVRGKRCRFSAQASRRQASRARARRSAEERRAMKGRARTKLGERDFRHPKETLILLTVGTNAKIGEE